VQIYEGLKKGWLCGKHYSMEDEKKKEMKAEEAPENNETTRL